MKMKNKLMAVSLMLVVSILMMTTASFAWFTISTAPEITGMTTTVVVNENLEIAYATSTTVPVNPGEATDTTTPTIWGNLISLDGTTYDSLDKTLRPMVLSDSGNGFKYPTYGDDGRINGFEEITDTEAVGADEVTAETGNKVYGHYYDIWVRTNVAGDIKLIKDGVGHSTADTTTLGGGSNYVVTKTGTGTATETALQMAADALQIGFKVIGESEIGTDYAYPAATTDFSDTITQIEKEKATDANTYNLKDQVLFTAEANVAYLVRIYVWLDGDIVTNAGASIANAALTGDINLQFANAAITTGSMDNQA